jgi:hypothetical protein
VTVVRVWFRKGGASDGLWWEAEFRGETWGCSDVEFRCPARTQWERDEQRPRSEQRHFIEATASRVEWDGARLVLE